MSKKVLLADDSPVIQTLSKKILTGQGYEFTGLKSGEKVMSEIKKQKFDIIILDIILPSVNGMELAKMIRNHEDPKIAATPIIAISGNYKNYTKSDFEAVGINDYIIKPLDYDALVNAVKKYS